jgi:hypothetical protein
MSTLLELLKTSVLTQALVTLIVLVVDCYLIIAGENVPPELWGITSLVIGFYFGSKVGIIQGQNTALKSQGK